MKKSLVILLILSLITSIVSLPAFASNIQDISENHWAYESVKTLVNKGYVSLYDDNTFRGSERLSRYEMAVIVARLLENIESGTSSVTDEDSDLVRQLSVEFQDELVDLAEQGRIFEERIKQLEQKNIIQDEVISEMKVEEIAVLNQDVNDIQNDISNIIDNIILIKNLEEEIKELRETTNQKLTSLDSKANENAEKIKELERVELQLKDNFISELEDKLNDNHNKINNLQNEVNELKGELTRKDQKIEELENETGDSQTLLYGAAGIALVLLLLNG